jgi:hypothetical protein
LPGIFHTTRSSRGTGFHAGHLDLHKFTDSTLLSRPCPALVSAEPNEVENCGLKSFVFVALLFLDPFFSQLKNLVVDFFFFDECLEPD